MTAFEQWSLIAYYLQLALIGGGLWLMQRAGARRDRQLDRQEKALEDMGAGIRAITEGLREQSAGIRALLERGT